MAEMASRADEEPAVNGPAPGGGTADGMTALFVRRPVLAAVVNAMIVIAGLAALLGIEVRELPQVDRPVLTVNTSYDGAAPETIDREVTAVIESAMGRVQGVSSISSRSSFGRSRVTVEFGADVDLNVAASDARDAVARVVGALPDEADPPQIVKADANGDPVMRLGLTSTTMTSEQLTDLAENEISDRLMAARGVADVQVFGGRELIFRVDVDEAALASRGLTVADVRDALRTVAFDSPAGSIRAANQSLTVRTTAAVDTPEEIAAVMLTPETRLSDVATVTLGPATGQSVLRSNGEAGLGLGILRQAQGNTLTISRDVRAVVAGLQGTLPEGVKLFVTGDDAVFINGAIHEVLLSLGLSAVIVVGVIWLFLRDWRATLIPAVTIPVALVGTVAALYLLGFSVNILTLLALVLATGLVVDDAIVVLENIVRRRGQGLGPRAAAVLGTRQVFFAVIATTTTLAAVFVPLSFLPGQSGALFREFGITLAVSVAISAFVALSLCPVLAARFLGPGGPREGGWLGRLGGRLAGWYLAALRRALDAPLVVLAVGLVFGVTALLMAMEVREELTPPEDRGAVLVRVATPQGVSLAYTAAKLRELEARTAWLRQDGEVRGTFSVAGANGLDNAGFMVFTLAPWGERARSQQAIAADVAKAAAGVIGMRAYPVVQNSLGIRGAGQGVQVALLGSDFDVLGDAAQQLKRAMEDSGAFGLVRVSYEPNQPQLAVRVDRERATDLGIDIDGLGETLQAVLDGRSVGSVFVADRSHDIEITATANPVQDPGDLEALFLKTRSGEMVPMSAVVTLEERPVAPELAREDQARAVTVTGALAGDTTLADAWALVERLAGPLLPPGGRLVPLSDTAAQGEASGGLARTFGFAVLVVLLVLAAQFESFVSALIVMATVPLGLACAVVAMGWTGISLNVYSQIGLVLLVGIIAKNGILVVEFANQLRDHGAGVREAIEEACAIRLRPVMMTMLATILGGVPLLLSVGPGAEARHALGWVMVGGLGLATVLTLFVNPVAYLLFAGLSRPRAEATRQLEAELAGTAGE